MTLLELMTIVAGGRRLPREMRSFSREDLIRIRAEVSADFETSERENRILGASSVHLILTRMTFRRMLLAIDHEVELGASAGHRNTERLARCRTVLKVANRLLPPEVREEVLDEWMDDVETALEEGLPPRRRVASIVRSLPRMVWQCRRRAQARRERS